MDISRKVPGHLPENSWTFLGNLYDFFRLLLKGDGAGEDWDEAAGEDGDGA